MWCNSCKKCPEIDFKIAPTLLSDVTHKTQKLSIKCGTKTFRKLEKIKNVCIQPHANKKKHSKNIIALIQSKQLVKQSPQSKWDLKAIDIKNIP